MQQNPNGSIISNQQPGMERQPQGYGFSQYPQQYPPQQPMYAQQRYPPQQQMPQYPQNQYPPQQPQCNIDVTPLQLLIESYLQFYLPYDEIIRELDKRNVSTEMAEYILKKLKEQNPNYFKAYEIRLSIKSQIARFNDLIQRYLVTANQQNDQQNIQQNPQPQAYQQDIYQDGYNPNLYQGGFTGDQNMGM